MYFFRLDMAVKVVVLLTTLLWIHRTNDIHTRINNIVTAYRELLSIDDQISCLLLSFKQEWVQRLSLTGVYTAYQIVGSIAEGCFSPSLFYGDSSWSDGLRKELDLDVEYKFLHYSLKYKHCIRDLQKPGFVAIQVDSACCYCTECVTGEYIDNVTDTNVFLLPYKVKEVLVQENEVDDANKMYQTISCLLNFTFINSKQNVTKATYYQSHTIYKDGEMYILSFDVGLIVRLDWQTDFITKWMKRKRVWPKMKDLLPVLNTTYVIGKTSHQEKNNVSTREFRYSFSHIERRIISLQSQNQRLVYYVAKAIYNRWIKPIHPNILQSFMLKNILLWTSELYYPQHKFWGNIYQPNVTLKAVKFLYENLLESLKNGQLSFYFIPEINIIQNIPARTVKAVIKVVREIVSNTAVYIPKETDAALDTLRSARKNIFEISDLINLFYAMGSFGIALKRKYAIECLTKYLDVE